MDLTPPAAEDGGSSAAQAIPGTDTLEALRSELEAARGEAADLKDKFLRAKAETENVRRRAEADIAAARKYGIESFATELLAVRDSLDLAQAVVLDKGSSEAVQKMYEGIELTLKLMDGAFQKFGITLLDPLGEKFDPTRHQAISTVESEQLAPNHVVSVVQKGYLLKERLLRPAMVVVARAKSGGNPPPSA
jgi:molecular chaperone GrpE